MLKQAVLIISQKVFEIWLFTKDSQKFCLIFNNQKRFNAEIYPFATF